MDVTHLEQTLRTDAAIVAALLIEGRTADADAHVERSGHVRRLRLWQAGRSDQRETRTYSDTKG